MIDKLVDTLVGSGPLGILCAVLLVVIAIMTKIIRDVFKMYVASQEARIKEGLESQQITMRLTSVIQATHDMLQNRRR